MARTLSSNIREIPVFFGKLVLNSYMIFLAEGKNKLMVCHSVVY